MNWVDFLVILAVGGTAYRGVRRGLLAAGPEMASFVAAFFLAIVAYPLAGGLLGLIVRRTNGLTNALGLVLVWVFVQSALLALLNRYLPRHEEIRNSRWNRAGGAIAAAEGVVLSGLLLTLVVVFPSENLPKDAVLNARLGRPMVETTFGFESFLAERLGGPASPGVFSRTLRPGVNERVNLHFRTMKVSIDKDAEQRMLTLVNAERIRAGLVPLVMDEHLQSAAREHSRDMFAHGYLGHIAPDGRGPAKRLRDAGIGDHAFGENVAIAPTVNIAHSGLMQSPGHRANILNPHFRRVGIGAADSGVFGTAFTQEFTD